MITMGHSKDIRKEEEYRIIEEIGKGNTPKENVKGLGHHIVL